MGDRRDFLGRLSAGGAYFAFRGLLPGAAWASRKSFPPGTWGGNDPALGHDLVRDARERPSVRPSRRVEVVVVGGGLAGLAAAYTLRSSSILLLEQLGRTGGHCVRDRWNDVWFAGGGAYFVEPEPPLDAFYEEIRLPLRKIAEPADSAILGWNEITDTFGAGLPRLPYPKSVRRDFLRAKRDFTAILEGDDCPVMPLGETSEASKAFDRMTFADWMTKEKRYHPAVKAYVDLYCRSAFGAPSSEHISAFAGLNFYVSEFSARYTLPGGNAVAAELLRDAVERAGSGRILTGATAVRVEASPSGVVVTYVDAEGRVEAVEAGAAILATPKFATRHVIAGLPKERFDAMGELAYGSYVVANVLCSSPIVDRSYDTWTDVSPFTDFIVADWIARGADRKPTRKQQVLTVYYPVAYEHAQLLEDGAYDAFRERVADHLGVLYPGADSKIEDVRLYRWGHALCHGRPGWYTERSAVASAPLGPIFFAHSDNQGLPAFESALVEGIGAARAAKEAVARVAV